MYNYSVESALIIWHTTNEWQQAIDEWSRTRLSLTCDDVAIYVSRNGEFVTRLENEEDIKNHSEFLLAVRDSSNRVEGRIMMDMYEQEVNGMNIIEPKDKLDLPKEWQEPYAEYMLRKSREETNYMLDEEEADYNAAFAEMEGSDLTVDFHGNFEEMDDYDRDIAECNGLCHQWSDIFCENPQCINKQALDIKPDFHGKFEDMDDDEQDQIINPSHYKMIPKEAYEKNPEGLEYMDLMEYILAHHKGVESHLLGQVFKYACRLGKKDADLQDARKIQWYANRLVKVIDERS